MSVKGAKARNKRIQCVIDVPPENEGEPPLELDLVKIVWALVSDKSSRLDNKVAIKDSDTSGDFSLNISKSKANDAWEITWW